MSATKQETRMADLEQPRAPSQPQPKRVWKNVGPVDRAIRLAGGALLVAVGLFLLEGLRGSAVGLVVGTFGLWFMATGGIGVCPLYVPFGISTVRTTHGPFGIRLRSTHGPAARSSE